MQPLADTSSLVGLTTPDCQYAGQQIPYSLWFQLDSAQLASVVGTQAPLGPAESAENYDWSLQSVPTRDLLLAAHEGEVPEGGWQAAYLRQLEADRTAVQSGSPEYAGRDEWLRRVWVWDTLTYPLYLVKEPLGHRLWDGHHRLAAAFYYGALQVYALVGTPKTPQPIATAHLPRDDSV